MQKRNLGSNVRRSRLSDLVQWDMLRAFAAKRSATPAQIALSWLLAQKPWIVPIPGINKLEYLVENLASADVVLSPGDLREIDTAASKIKVQGARLGEGLLQLSEA